MTQIRRNKIVYLDLTVLDEQGQAIESTDGGDAFCYLHGRGNLLPALESVLDGQAAGFETELTLPPAEAFGDFHEDLVVTVPLGQLGEGVSLELGTQVQAAGPHGPIAFTLQSVIDDHATLNANHPLAGKTLIVMLKVLSVRDAHKDEVKHRRPHPGGHHLMMSDSSWRGE